MARLGGVNGRPRSRNASPHRVGSKRRIRPFGRAGGSLETIPLGIRNEGPYEAQFFTAFPGASVDGAGSILLAPRRGSTRTTALPSTRIVAPFSTSIRPY